MKCIRYEFGVTKRINLLLAALMLCFHVGQAVAGYAMLNGLMDNGTFISGLLAGLSAAARNIFLLYNLYHMYRVLIRGPIPPCYRGAKRVKVIGCQVFTAFLFYLPVILATVIEYAVANGLMTGASYGLEYAAMLLEGKTFIGDMTFLFIPAAVMAVSKRQGADRKNGLVAGIAGVLGVILYRDMLAASIARFLAGKILPATAEQGANVEQILRDSAVSAVVQYGLEIGLLLLACGVFLVIVCLWGDKSGKGKKA